jgi:hemolysin activation/secretion protein
MLSTSAVYAFPFPNSGSLYQDVRDGSLVLEKDKSLPKVQIEDSPLEAVSGESLEVSSFVVFGNTQLEESVLLDALAPFSHRKLEPGELNVAVNALRDAYRTRGIFAAQVYIPPQAIEDGVVTLHVYEGTLEEEGVSFNNDSDRLHSDRVTSILEENLATGAVMTAEEFERTILLVDDLPGITSSAIIYPGTNPGEARFNLRAEDTPMVSGNIDVDNFGSYYTGEQRLGATVYVNNPTGMADQLTFRAVTSGSDSNYFFADYSAPVGGSGLRLGVNADYLDYEIGEEFSDLGFEGDAYSVRLFGTYPFIRSRHNNLSGRAEYAYLSLTDDDATGLLLADRRVQTLTLGVDGDHDDDYLAAGVSFYNAAITLGSTDIRGGEEFKAFDDANSNIDGSFLRVNFNVSRLQHLGGNWSAMGALSGQWANENLDSSQKFYLGGPFSIPGYPTGEMSGDHGARIQADLRHDWNSLPWQGDLQLSLFYTAGWAKLFADTWDGWEGALPTFGNELTLSSWGLAVSQTWSSGIVLRASAGRQIGDNDAADPITGEATDRSDSDYRAWFQAIYYF